MTVTADDVRAAAQRLAGRIERTPLLRAHALGDAVWVKAELFQRSGAFKVRGALNRLDALGAAERAAGATTVSAGNHARALAHACARSHVPLTVFMWRDASPYKVAATRALGAEVDLASADPGEAFAAMFAFAARTGATVVHPFDDPAIVAGAGTVGLEIAEDLPEVACAVVPVGGGGLISGVALALRAHRPDIRIVAVEPEWAATLTAALAAGAPVEVPHRATCADALAPPAVGALNLSLCRELVDAVVTVSEEDLAAGLRAAYADLKLACEPGGAAAVAAIVSGAVAPAGPTVLVASGGNVDPDLLRRLL
jgi:threonine dehydratase